MDEQGPAQLGRLDDLAERIRARGAVMSDGQRAVADFILQNYEKAAFLTAARLGEHTGVSESTVVRFAMALGYEGYPEMQRSLHDLVRNRLTTVDRLLGSAQAAGTDQAILDQVMLQDCDNIRRTLQETDPSAFTQAVDMVLSARRIYVAGLRSASSLAVFLALSLNWVLGNTQALHLGVEDWLEQMSGMGPEDLLIAVTFPRYTRKTVEIAQFAASRATPVLAITDSVMSPVGRYATRVLTAKSAIDSYVDSFTAPLSLINALLTAVGQRSQERTVSALRQLEGEWRKYRVFWEE